MRRVLAAAALAATMLFAAACSSDSPATTDPTGTASQPGSTLTADPNGTPPDDEGGNPTCVAVFNLLEQLRGVEDQYVIAVGPDATKAAAAKTVVQTKLRQVAADIRKAAGSAPEKAVKDAAEKAAAGFEAGANDAQLFAPKDAEAALNALNQATVTWTQDLLATC